MASAGRGKSQGQATGRGRTGRADAENTVEEGEGGTAGAEKGMSEQAEALEEARLREACVFRARVMAAVRQQEEREAKAPLERTVSALDDLLTHVADSMGTQGRLDLQRHSRHLEEIKRSYWGCGVSYPRSGTFREALDLETFSCLAGSADGTMWESEASFCASKDQFARQCMLAVDTDRCLCAEDLGYVAAITSMCAGDADKAGQKNQLLIGRFAAV